MSHQSPSCLQQSTGSRGEGKSKESGVDRAISPVQEESVFPQEFEEEIIPHGMIRLADEEAIFTSVKHKVRVRVQKDSVASQTHTAGPVTLSILNDTIDLEGIPLQGILQVKGLPSGYRFNAPLLFDFPVGGEGMSNDIMDEYGRVHYEVRTL